MIKGITAGVFDLCHAGHILMLEYCRRHCDTLTVAVQVDPSQHREGKSKPVETIYERWVRLANNDWVNEIIPYETEDDLRLILQSEDYDIRFIGEDHKGKSFTGDNIRPETFHYNPRGHSLSSTELKERIKDQ